MLDSCIQSAYGGWHFLRGWLPCKNTTLISQIRTVCGQSTLQYASIRRGMPTWEYSVRSVHAQQKLVTYVFIYISFGVILILVHINQGCIVDSGLTSIRIQIQHFNANQIRIHKVIESGSGSTTELLKTNFFFNKFLKSYRKVKYTSLL
jgi:hypothetical protein